MATLKDFRDERLRKLNELRSLGFNPYPSSSVRDRYIGDIVFNFDEKEGQTVVVAGRVQGIRKFGKLAFVVIKDASGSIQLFIREGILAPTEGAAGLIGVNDLSLLDSGDFVEASGKVIKTQTGEISIETTNLKLLAKALRPLPTQQEGFSNKEVNFGKAPVIL